MIIDGTPCELVTDSVALSRIVDSTVIVSACGETKKDNLDRVIKSIQNVGGRLIGVIVNKVPVSVKKYSETYYYGSTRTTSETVVRKNKVNPNELKNRNSNIASRNTTRPTSKIQNVEKKDSMEIPKALQNNTRETVSKDRMNDILGQINSYLDEEKKDLN